MENQHSPQKWHEVRSGQRFVDTRSELTKIWEAITSFQIAASVNAIFVTMVFMMPWTFVFCFAGILIVTLRASTAKNNKTLPVKLPIELKDKYVDRNAPYPGRRKYKKASGTVMLGNTRSREEREVWQEIGDLLTHNLVIGATGSGKTEMLISLVGATAFCQGSGTFYIDPKAGNLLLVQIVCLCKLFGRIDDLRVMNYKTGGLTVLEKHYRKKTNTFSPFALGTDRNIFQILGTLLPTDAGQNQSFLNSAIELMKAALPTLCELRDRGYIQLTPGLIADYLNLVHLSDLVFETEKNVFVPSQNEKITVDISDKSLKPLKMYFNSIQLDNSNRAKPPEPIIRTFGYAKSYYGEPLSNLAANYGHMYDYPVPEISLEDVLYNNRILLSMIPALELPPAEQKTLGKISLATAKQAMALGLGAETEGTYTDLIENLPVDKKLPFILIADEYAEIAVPGFAVAATQGRSVTISTTFGSQDLDGLIRADKDEAGMIFANTLNKWLMRTQDPETTWKKFKELASTTLVTEAGNYKESNMLKPYRKEISATIKEVDSIHFKDVVSQDLGEAHFFERGNVHKINVFYHGITEKTLKNITFRYNRLLPILPPSSKEIEIIREYIEASAKLEQNLTKGSIYPEIEALDFEDIIANTDLSGGLFSQAIDQFKEYDKPLQPKASETSTAPIPVDSALSQANDGPIADKSLDALQRDLNKEDGVDEENENDLSDIILDKRNHWLFSDNVESDVENSSIAMILKEKLQQINNAIYDENDSNLSSAEAISVMLDTTATELRYTSEPVVEPKESDVDLMWEMLEKIQS